MTRAKLSWPQRLALGLHSYEKEQLARAGSIEKLEQEREAARARSFERRHFLLDLEEPRRAHQPDTARIEKIRAQVFARDARRSLLDHLEEPGPRLLSSCGRPRPAPTSWWWGWAYTSAWSNAGPTQVGANHMWPYGDIDQFGDGVPTARCGVQARTGVSAAHNDPVNGPQPAVYCAECLTRQKLGIGWPGAWAAILDERIFL